MFGSRSLGTRPERNGELADIRRDIATLGGPETSDSNVSGNDLPQRRDAVKHNLPYRDQVMDSA